jgi:hypothetical protein
LNWRSARVLLAGAGARDWREAAEQSVASWRMSWRAYRVCATTAGQILEIAHEHAQADCDDLWRALLAPAPEGADAGGCRGADLHEALRRVQAAYGAYVQALLALQRELVAVAEEDR